METIVEDGTSFKIVDSGRDYSKINSANMEIYLSASAQVDLLNAVIISPFEDKLKEDTKFSKDKRPEKKVSLERRIGNHMFYIDVKPTSKPKYGEVFEFISNYLNGLEHGKLEGKKREGVRSSEEGIFVALDDVLNNFSNAVSETIQPSVDFSIATSKGKKSADLTKSVLQLDFSRDYSKTEGEGSAANARDYIEAKKIVKNVEDTITGPFEKSVKEATGYSKGNIPNEVKYTKNPVGNVLCYGVSYPQESISYGKIMEGFEDYLKMLNEESANSLKSSLPELRRFDGKDFVKLSALQERMGSLKEGNTAVSLRQNMHYLKRPKDDKIIVD